MLKLAATARLQPRPASYSCLSSYLSRQGGGGVYSFNAQTTISGSEVYENVAETVSTRSLSTRFTLRADSHSANQEGGGAKVLGGQLVLADAATLRGNSGNVRCVDDLVWPRQP